MWNCRSLLRILPPMAVFLFLPALSAEETEQPDPAPALPEGAAVKTIDQTDPEFWGMATRHTESLSPETYAQAGRSLLAQGTYKSVSQAVKLLRQAVLLHAEDGLLHALYAEALVAPYRWTWDRDEVWLERAGKALAQARALDEDAVPVHRVQALLEMLDNRLEAAEGSLRQALVQKPEDLETLLLLGAVLRLQDDHHEAYATYDRALSLAPGAWRVYSGLADVYRDDEWFEEALNLYRKAQQLQPWAFPPRFGQALVFHRVNYAAQAVRMYHKLMDEFPKNADMVLLAAAATHMRERQFGAAIRELEQNEFVGHRGLCRGSVLYRLGLCRVRVGDSEGAIAAFREVIEEYPLARDSSDYGPLVLFPAATQLSTLYEQAGQPEEAAEVLRRASEHPQAPLSVQLGLAEKLLAYRLFDMAVEVLRRGLSRETPEDPLAERVRLRLQLIRAEEGAGAGQGTRLAEVEEEVEKDGTSADCYQLARGYALAGEAEQAVQWLRQAVERGYRAFDLIRRDPDLESLHALPAFRDLVRGR
jgi:tetratricopeptide (TPR) repeat protein